MKSPGENTRNPIQGEYFSTDAIKNPANALIREAVQNSLDAKLANDEPIKIHINLATGDKALPPLKVKKWFDGAWEHITAEKNGLREAPKPEESCPYLVFEDFNTTGLVGDVIQDHPIESVKNAFFLFYRAEGLSDKDGGLGRWGVGKHVFPRSSRANSFIGLTIRNTDKLEALMGHSVFKCHTVEGKFYVPDGYLGEKSQGELITPCQDKQQILDFKKDFGLKRESESGLSVVIPWVDSEITEDKLVAAIIRNYFYPILTGNIIFEIKSSKNQLIINDQNIYEKAELLDKEEHEHLLNIVHLAEWASVLKPAEHIKLNPINSQKPIWDDKIIPTEGLKEIREQYYNSEKIATTFQLNIRKKGSQDKIGTFNLYIWKTGEGSEKPTFIRDGLIISSVQTKRCSGFKAIVLCEGKENPLSKLLGDSENPAHTEWNSGGENFRGKYINGSSYIDFVANAAARFIYTLTANDEEEDFKATAKYFPDIEGETGPIKPRTRCRKCGKIKSECTCDIPKPKPKAYKITEIDGGFTLTKGDPGAELPEKLLITCAYDVRSGDPLKAYQKSLKAKCPDFEIGKNGITIINHNGVRTNAELNTIEIEILESDFFVEVSGFDPNRDLYVKVTKR